MATYVWRVENRSGRGPYRWAEEGGTMGAYKDILCAAHADPNHPDGWQDGLAKATYPNTGLVFGFRSRKLAEAWFAGWWGRLKKKGYRLVRRRASVVIEGKSKRQLAFKPVRRRA